MAVAPQGKVFSCNRLAGRRSIRRRCASTSRAACPICGSRRAHHRLVRHRLYPPRGSAAKSASPAVQRPKPPKLRSVAISPRLVFLLDLGSGECRYPYGGDVDRRAYTLCRYPRLKSLYVSVACTWKAMLSDAPPPTRESPESHRLMQLLKEMQGN